MRRYGWYHYAVIVLLVCLVAVLGFGCRQVGQLLDRLDVLIQLLTRK